jgi:hypothetical protein
LGLVKLFVRLTPEPFYAGCDVWRKIAITLKTPSPQRTTALWGRTDGANVRYRLITSTMIHNCDKLGVLDNLD